MNSTLVGYGTTYTGRIPEITSNLRYRHTYILGKTGKGKSTLIHNMLLQDAERRYAIFLLDAGDLAEQFIESLDNQNLDRVLYFSPRTPIPYNPLARSSEKDKIKAELSSLLDQVTVESSTTQGLTARMRDIVYAAVDNAEAPLSFHSLADAIINKVPKLKEALGMTSDGKEPRFEDTYFGVRDRVKQFFHYGELRRIICPESELDFNRIIDEGRIFVVDLGGLHPSITRLIGTMLLQGFTSTLLERDPTDRRDIAAYIDEFQDYIASAYSIENFKKLFRQGRRYRLSLTIAHQDFGDMNRGLLSAVQNAGTIVTFACGTTESSVMSRIMSDVDQKYSSEFIRFMEDAEALARIDTNVFFIKTYPPPAQHWKLNHDTPLPPAPPNPFDAAIERQPPPASSKEKNSVTQRRRPTKQPSPIAERVQAATGKSKKIPTKDEDFHF